MPEGHTLHRLARHLTELFAGQAVRASSPQGRFAESAALIDGAVLKGASAYGKHLFIRFADRPEAVHVHLGLIGKFTTGPQPAPAAKGALRLRLETATAYADLRGATICELIPPDDVTRILGRLGPDPLQRKANPDVVWTKVHRRRTPIGAVLMDQSVLAGVGNVFRAEALFAHGISPLRVANTVTREEFDALWLTVNIMLRAGRRSGRIVTTKPEHRDRRSGPARAEDAHYVYRRTDLPCRVCGTPIRKADLAGRNSYWCPSCQPD
ncbi:MAG: DNA-formamidopyrimidine glycosylase family protein [Actinomycetota bacterium]